MTEPWPTGWLTANDLQEWRRRYESAEPLAGPIDVSGIAWQRCLCSDLKRAVVTAQAAYAGEIVQTPLLEEAEFLPFALGRLRLPVWGWRTLLRLAWLTGHKSQRAARDQFLQRISAGADLLEADPVDTLVVSHAGVMFFLRKELVRRGFRGPNPGLADHGRLYLLERPGT